MRRLRPSLSQTELGFPLLNVHFEHKYVTLCRSDALSQSEAICVTSTPKNKWDLTSSCVLGLHASPPHSSTQLSSALNFIKINSSLCHILESCCETSHPVTPRQQPGNLPGRPVWILSGDGCCPDRPEGISVGLSGSPHPFLFLGEGLEEKMV